jgi:hypothetical protein
MAIYDFFLSRNNGPTIANYVGHVGRLFYDSANGVIKLSDGATPGGLDIPYTIASDTVVGGIKAGPGVTINAEGQILIDSEGLEFSFGDFSGTVGTYAVGNPDAGEDYALLSSVNANEDIILASNGDGIVKVIGDFSVRTPNGGLEGALLTEPIFRVSGDGQVRMLVPLADQVAGALEIIGNDTGLYLPPTQTGVILHITGNSGLVCRNYFDANANYALLAGRRYNGTQLDPRRVLNNEIVFRIIGQAANATTANGVAEFGTYAPARMTFYANEDQTPTAQGGRIQFEITKNGTAADAVGTNTITVVSMDAQNGITAIKFNGPLTGNVTGDVSGSAGSVAAANITGTTLASNVVTSSLTTVGTLGNLTVTNLVTASNYHGQARDAGTLGAAGTLTIDFATDNNVLVNLTTTATIAFSNITAGKTVTVLVKNATGQNRTVTTGVVAGNNSTGSATNTVNDGRTGVFIYRTFGTASTDVYCQISA